MTELLTAAQMRAIEQAAIDSGAVTGLELMERAGRGVVEAIFEEWPEVQTGGHRAVVLCGPGNNGGDGFVVARLLQDAGWTVEVLLYGDADKLPPDARVNYERWAEMGEVTALSRDALLRSGANVAGGDILVVDALFGTGLARPLDQNLSQILAAAGATDHFAHARRVSIDIPSGLCSDSGRGLWDTEPMIGEGGLTVSFHRAKLGHHIGGFDHLIGTLKTVSIGLDDMPPPAEPIAPAALTDPCIDALAKGPVSHKYTHGHALILAGGPGRTGAARLAARGALRIGAGLVTIACPRNSFSEVAGQVSAIMCRGLDGPPGLRELLEDKRLNALCLGPGMGLGADTQALVMSALQSGRAVVLDADALMRFERNPQTLFDLLHDNSVITPHGGEFARLFPDIAEKLAAPATKGPAYSKLDATREAAARAGCIVVFKGPDTVIAAPDGHAAINSSAYERAAPWLATAGAGDVLAGFITGLLARGFAPMQAAETGAWLHTECARSFGPGLIAEDLPEELPKVFKALLANP